ncbi:hypothetical protein UVI_02042450 [Ustilaginoidea virens]|nr:hypothetical protein UVI_02042450 [Ustilaginoidea virens]
MYRKEQREGAERFYRLITQSSRSVPAASDGQAEDTPTADDAALTPSEFNLWCAVARLRAQYEWSQRNGMIDIIEGLGLPRTVDYLTLYYGGRAVDDIPTSAVFKAETGPGRLAFIHLRKIEKIRDKHLGLKHARSLDKLFAKNKPVATRTFKKLQRLQPAVETEDPYIAGILIALAQEQRQARGRASAERVRAIALPYLKHFSTKAYFYTACIPKAFLDRLERPWEAGECDEVTVRYGGISLKDEEAALQCFRKFLDGTVHRTDE